MKFTNVRTVVIVLIGVAFTLTLKLSSQSNFTNYDFRHGLPVDNINGIARDSAGFMWFGSSNGVIRFDGLEFVHINGAQRDPEGMTGRDITGLEVHQNGEIWTVSSDVGITVYRPNGAIVYQAEKGTNGIPLQGVRCVYHDNVGATWVGTPIGLFQFDRETGKFTRAEGMPDDPIDVIDILAHPTESSTLILGGRRLYQYHTQGHVLEQLSESGSGNRWYELAIDEENTLWARHYFSNVSRYNFDTGESDSWHSDIELEATSIICKDDRSIWLGTKGNGILRFDKDSEEWSEIRQAAYEQRSLASDVVRDLYLGSKGEVWIGTASAVSLLDPSDQVLDKYEVDYPDDKSLPVSVFGAVRLPGSDELLLATYYRNKALIYNPDEKRSREVEMASNASHLVRPANVIDLGGTPYVVYSNGVGEYDMLSDRIVELEFDNRSPDFPKRRPWTSMGHNGKLYIVYLDNKLVQIDPLTGGTKVFNCEGLHPGSTPRSITIDGESDVWMASADGIRHLDMETGRIGNYMNADTVVHGEGQTTNDVAVTPDGALWIAMYKGPLIRAELQNGELIEQASYGYEQGLGSERISTLDVDKDGRLYASSPGGLYVYDEDSDRFFGFGAAEGLLMTDCDQGLQILGEQIYIFHRSGFSRTNWENLTYDSALPKTVIRDVEFKDTSASVFSNGLDFGQVKYGNNDVSFTYSAVNYGKPEAIRYSYRLAPSQEWQKVEFSERQARYPDLRPGEYTFEVRASILPDEWGPEASVSFEVLPPFWRTWWFISAVGIIFLLIVIGILRYREQQRRTVTELRVRMAELQSESLRAQMNPHFIFNSLNSIKSFIIENKRNEASDYLTLFAELIRLILHNSRSHTIPLADELRALEVYCQLENMRLGDKFDAKFQIDHRVDTHVVRVPPLGLQPFVENAIWHGFVHKQERGLLTVVIDRDGNNLIAKVTDDGVGRERSREIEQNHPRKRSYGIAITRQRLDITGGADSQNVTIRDLYDSAGETAGTEVTIILPLLTNQI